MKKEKPEGLHRSTGEVAIVDDLRPRGKRATAAVVPAKSDDENDDERQSESESEAESEGESASVKPAEELPLPDAPPRSSAKMTLPATPRAKGIPAPDPRIPEVEKALARGDWGAIAKLLAPSGDTATLPPRLRLLWAVATKEAQASAGTAVDAVAIEALAELLEVAKESPLALVLAKRTLRRRTWTSTPAPSATVSTLIVVLGLGLGLGLGWLLTIWLF